MENGIIYSGPSLIDGAPIVVIATTTKSNRKTGAVVQTYILRADMNPLEANKTGADFAICGNCPLRGESHDEPGRKTAKNRGCYVNLGQGVLIVWKALQRGVYAPVNGHAPIASIGAGKVVRLGTYGDPCAVPSYIWESLISDAAAHTAYTHGGVNVGANPMPGIAMTSADSEAGARDAWNRGERTFRVVSSVADIIKGKEILCPASKEAGARVTCAQCKLCNGAKSKAKSIAIPAHGTAGTTKNAIAALA